MNDFQFGILNALIDKYEKSVLSTVGSKRNVTIKLTSRDEILSKYDSMDSYLYFEMYNQDIKGLDSLGYIIAHFDRCDVFEYLELNRNRIDDIYSVLHRKNPRNESHLFLSFLENYECNGFLKEFIASLIEKIRHDHRIPKTFSSIQEAKSIFDVIQCMENQKEEIMERDFSIKYLGDSKRFSSLKQKACRIIYDYDQDYPYSDDDFDADRILAYFNITRNSTAALIKNNLSFKVKEQNINLNEYGHVFYLSDEAISDMEILDSKFKRVITIENLTTFKGYQDKQAVIIYLAGFNNHTKQMLLKKIYERYPNKEYLHFSDIDCGGFLIFNHLVESTGIPFKPFHMSVTDMKKPRTVLKPLTSNDVTRLEKMSTDEKFKPFWEVISYMLSIGKKLEQEALDI